MKLNVQERLVLTRIIPEKGNFETMTIVDKLKEVLFPSEEEVEEFEIKQTETQITWNVKGATEKVEIELSAKGKAIILKSFEELDKKEELNAQSFALFKRFKEEEGEE